MLPAHVVWIVPLIHNDAWQIDCICFFSHACHDYAAMYRMAELHLREHYGPDPPIGPIGSGGQPAPPPDTDPKALAAMRYSWDFYKPPPGYPL